MNRDKLLDRMIANTRKVVDDLEQLVRDIKWWNANRNDADPFDFGRDLVALKAAREYLAYLETRPTLIEGDLYSRLCECFKDDIQR